MGCRWVADAPLWLRFLHAPLAGPLFVATDIRRGANDTPPQPRERRPGFTHGCFVCTCPCAESRISPLNASCTITNYLGLHSSVNLTGHGHRPPVVACVVEDGTQRAGETPSTVLSTRERSAPSSPAMHRPSPGSCPCLLWPIGVANPGGAQAACSSPTAHHAACLGVSPLPAGCGTSWQLFERSQEVCRHPHSSKLGPHRSHRPFLTWLVCLYARTGATKRGASGPSDVGSIATSPEIAATVSAAFELSGDRRDRQSEVRRACHFSNPTAGAAMLTAVSVRARHYACHGALIGSRVCRLSLIPARLERVRRRSGRVRSPRASPMTTLPAPRHERAMAVRAPAGRRTRPTHGRSESHRAG